MNKIAFIRRRVETSEFFDFYTDVLNRTFFKNRSYNPQDESQIADLKEHASARYIRFSDHVVPWIQNKVSITNAEVIEVGSGTGSGTLAFAPLVDRVISYEIDENSIAAADGRVRHFDIRNVHMRQEKFDANCEFIRTGKKADVVLLIAVLEHMTFDELESTLSCAWNCLRPGGIIVVAETPNRLSANDYHTGWLPFFQQLPLEVKERYADWSPRHQLVEDRKSWPSDHDARNMKWIRWGNGISYHEFEIILGPQMHNYIIADGHEAELEAVAPRFVDDEILEFAFKKLNLSWVNRAFTRWFLYFILQKPA